MEWKEVRLGDILNFRRGHDLPHSAMKPGNIPVAGSNGVIGYHDTATPIKPILTIGRSGNVGKPCFYEEAWAHNTTLYVDDFKGNDPKFLYYLCQTMPFANFGGGSAVPTLNRNHIHPLETKIPVKVEDQRRIASILSSLDQKIELNNKINADLEEMAQAIFKNWFVDFEPFKNGKFVDSELGMIPEGWKVGRLTEIASYMNGLAMQKFPPENNEDSLPVLKIKELGQGFCGTDSDRCSCNIKDECKIHNGDVIFSWSGTLLVDVWCGGDCGLNQHLFKVTSKDYPKWFYYYWTKHHLQEFIHIAKDKAVTMGHIKRGHLEEAMVAIPDNDSMEKAHELFEPILSKMISLRLENSRLSLLRDTLLPRLMSGELEVPE